MRPNFAPDTRQVRAERFSFFILSLAIDLDKPADHDREGEEMLGGVLISMVAVVAETRFVSRLHVRQMG